MLSVETRLLVVPEEIKRNPTGVPPIPDEFPHQEPGKAVLVEKILQPLSSTSLSCRGDPTGKLSPVFLQL